jgi:putative flavoprotein involved in K+ transport
VQARHRTETVVIGGGQAGLAMSRCLSDRGIDHVILERGRVAERWRSERWDSLRLLTPNWMTRLPGLAYDGDDPDGFMPASEVVGFLERYARAGRPPLETRTTVTRVAPSRDGFSVSTDRGEWSAPAVVIATGDSDVPIVPPFARALSPGVLQLVPSGYRRPSQVPDGGVLVVGGSSSGIQIADELQRAGHAVTIAVGGHTRVPRMYRGRDIMWWLDRAGLLDESADRVQDLKQSRRQPSLQLIGYPDRRSLDLSLLQDHGVHVTGRMIAIDGDRIVFADDLVATTAASDAKLALLLSRLDEFAGRSGLARDVEPAEPFTPIWPRFLEAPTTIDWRAAGIRTIVWAVGYRRRYSWLAVPALDEAGEIRHAGGVAPHPGLYVLGLRFLRRRNSSFIDGVGKDAVLIADHVAAFVRWRSRATA